MKGKVGSHYVSPNHPLKERKYKTGSGNSNDSAVRNPNRGLGDIAVSGDCDSDWLRVNRREFLKGTTRTR